MRLIHHYDQYYIALVQHLKKYLSLQLFLLFFSWPLLVAWGIPLTPLSIIGNILFIPFLTIFLFLSTGVFFAELVGLPTTGIIWSLESLTSLWLNLTSYAPQFFVVCPNPGWYILVPLPFIAVLLLAYKTPNPFKSVSLFSFFIICYTLFICIHPQDHLYFSYKKNSLKLIKDVDGTYQLHDNGLLGRRNFSKKWIAQTLIPTLYQNGISHTAIRCSKATNQTLEALHFLNDHFTIDKISIAQYPRAYSSRSLYASEQLQKKISSR